MFALPKHPDNPNFWAWLETLETTDKLQARESLIGDVYTDDLSEVPGVGFCCLGIACTIAPNADKYLDLGSSYLVLPPPVAEWLGLKPYYNSPSNDDHWSWENRVQRDGTGDGFDIALDMDFFQRDGRPASKNVAHYNDKGFTFREIADMIRYFGIDALV